MSVEVMIVCLRDIIFFPYYKNVGSLFDFQSFFISTNLIGILEWKFEKLKFNSANFA